MDTIFALSTARGKAGVAVVRISGPLAFSVFEHLGSNRPASRVASLRKLVHDDVVLDDALVLAFDGPGSFTGEDVAELHLHGSAATVMAIHS